jgi:Na+/H+ antiporter NhaD/arsenite permease-like protein
VHATPLAVPTVTILPFLLLLLAIAALPLVAPLFWEQNRNKGLVCLLLASPVGGWLVMTGPAILTHSLEEYLSFICLLGSLFVVAGGIHVSGNLVATPKTNTILLGTAAVLANFIGTTGASMLLIRLVLRTNSERRNTSHIPFFFILLAANCGGLLTPLGDPPLFLGYLRGVPFFWTLRLFPIWVVTVTYLLGLFFWFDRRAYAAERQRDLTLDVEHEESVRILGKGNLLFLLVIVGSVFLASPWRELVMLATALGSLALGTPEARRNNQFSFGPIVEVAILFFGIFVTMVPALELLREHGKGLGLVAPWQFFLTSGALSSVLDNAPTYLTFLSAAQGLSLPPEIVGVPSAHLVAISCGAVLMGANTYIGNGPNFMVKAIADAAGYRTPSFLGYAARALLVLAPVYGLITAYLWASAG